MNDRRIFRHIAFAGMFLLCAAMSFQRNTVWHTSISFWSDAAKKSPEKARTRNNLGYGYINAGNYYNAIKELKESVKIDYRYEEPHYNLCLAYGMKGEYDNAIAECGEVLKIDSFLKKGHMGFKPRYEAQAHNNLGNIYNLKKLYDTAVYEYQEAVKINPDAADTRFNLAMTYAKLGMNKEALKEYEAVLRLNPFDKEARRNKELLMQKR